MNERRVVITGIGVVSPVGNNLASFWDSLKAGRSGIGRIDAFDTEKFDCKIAGEVRGYDATPYYKTPKDVRRTDRYTQLAVGAAKMSLDDSGLDLGSIDLDRAGVMIGSGVGGLATMETQVGQMMTKGPDRTSPFMIPMMISNMASGFISMEHGLRGPNMAIVTACATANHCMGEAWRIIKFGDADIILAGGSEACIVPVGIAGFAAMRALSLRNDEPERASRPFDKDRNGFVMGEGAGVIILEEYEHAKKRGAKIYCELAGYGLTADAYHMSAPMPEGEGAARCMHMAMKHAKVNPEDVDYINAHGTSTPIGDACETKAVKRAFGASAHKVAVSSTKSMTGHLLGAAGAIEAIAVILAMQHGIVPPTINHKFADENIDPSLNLTLNKAQKRDIKVAMSNTFGFGGHNACVLFKKIDA